MAGKVKRAAENAVKNAKRYSKKHGIPVSQGSRRKSRRNNRNSR